jgi:hypothetical protein
LEIFDNYVRSCNESRGAAVETVWDGWRKLVAFDPIHPLGLTSASDFPLLSVVTPQRNPEEREDPPSRDQYLHSSRADHSLFVVPVPWWCCLGLLVGNVKIDLPV